MIYFDNAATGGRKPDSVIDAVTSAARISANPGRSGHKLALSCARIVLECRNALSDYFGGYGFERVVFTKNCTEAINIALFGLLEQGDHVVTTCMEHNSVLRPLEYLKKTGKITYDVCPLEEGNISPREIQSRLRLNTKMVVITAASNVTGTPTPLSEIRAVLPSDVLFVVDGAQGGGHVPIDLRKFGIDALALAGHKGLMAIQGSGALLLSDRVSPRPLLYGGTGSESFSLDMPSFFPDALEAGTISFPAVVSLLEGIQFLKRKQEDTKKYLLALTNLFLSRLPKNYTAYSKENPCGIVAFAHKDLPSEFLSETLSERGIAVRGGLHCAPLMHDALGTKENGLVRASFSPFNKKEEVAVLLDVLKQIDVSNSL